MPTLQELLAIQRASPVRDIPGPAPVQTAPQPTGVLSGALADLRSSPAPAPAQLAPAPSAISAPPRLQPRLAPAQAPVQTVPTTFTPPTLQPPPPTVNQGTISAPQPQPRTIPGPAPAQPTPPPARSGIAGGEHFAPFLPPPGGAQPPTGPPQQPEQDAPQEQLNIGNLIRRLMAFTPRQYFNLLPSQKQILASIFSQLGVPPEDAFASIERQFPPGVSPTSISFGTNF